MKTAALVALAVTACDYPRPARLHADAKVSPDVPRDAIDAPSCTWSMLMPTNFSYATLPAQAPAWTIASGTSVYHTVDGTGTGSPPVGSVLASGARLVYVASFTVASGATLIIDGDSATSSSLPLVIVADTIEIAGTIAVRSHATSCTNASGGACADNPGGGGGAFGGVGGAGGAAGGVSGPGSSPPSGNQQIVPLRAGCSGGPSAAAAGGTPFGSAGGVAGGALQLSAQYSLTVSGYIDANGLGGAPGSEVAASCGAASTGGGAGGAGGAIVLESCAITIPSTGRACANGGAGGSGGNTNPATAGHVGADGSCSTAALGGAATDTTSQNHGGNGGFGISPDGAGGGSGGTMSSGGGGGGGVGRIHIHAPAKSIDGSSTVSPPAFLD